MTDATNIGYVPVQVEDFHHVLPRCLRGKRTPLVLSCLVFFLFFLAVAGGGYGASMFFNNLHFADLKPDDSSRLHYTDRNYRDDYPGLFWTTPMYILIQSVPPGQPLTDLVRAAEITYFVEQLYQQFTGEWSGYWMVSWIRSYFSAGYRNDRLIGGVNNDTTVIVLNYNRWNYRDYEKTAVEDYVNGALAKSGHIFTAKISGIPALNTAMGDHVLANMGFIDAIAIPTGLIMFAIATRSPFSLFIPLVVIICSISTALGWGELLKHSMEVTGFAPELMATTVIGLSIDFSLFVVCRLKEFHDDPRIRATFTPVELIYLTFTHVAHNIAVSGIAVAAAFGGLAFIKSDFVRSIALLCMIGTLMTLLASLTVTPAMLYFLYPWCFDNCVTRACSRKTTQEEDRPSAQETVNGPRVIHYHPSDPLSLWGRAARWSTRRPAIVLTIALAILIFPMYHLIAHFDYDDNFFTSAPYTVPCWQDYADIMSYFHREVDTPITIVMASSDVSNAPLISEAMWPLYDQVVDSALASSIGLTLDDIDAPNIYLGERITYNQSLELMNATWISQDGGPYYDLITFLTSTIQVQYQLPAVERVLPGIWANPQYYTPGWIVIRLRCPTNLWSYNGPKYLDAAQSFMDDSIYPFAEQYYPYVYVGFEGANTDSWWVMRRVMDQFHLEVIITALMLFVAIGLLFRSVFFAVKLLLTMAYTVTLTFGLTMAVYYYPTFRGIWPALDQVHNMFWLIIVISFSVACVLSLDYDVFLIIRILEFRNTHRFNDVDSVIHAVSRSGPVISFAAFIMMIAFGALIFADTIMMNQFGLVLTLAVFVDAFLVRPLIVPALIAVMPNSRCIWFPRTMPSPLDPLDDDSTESDVID